MSVTKAEELARLYNHDRLLNSHFRDICKTGNLNVAKWIYASGKIKLDLDNYVIIRNMVYAQYTDIIEWLWEIDNSLFTNSKLNYELIKQSCEMGSLNMMRWLYKKTTITLEPNMKLKRTPYDIVVISKNKQDNTQTRTIRINLIKDDNYLFEMACHMDNIEMARWLYKESKSNTKADLFIDYLYMACENNSIEIAKWLYSSNNSNIPLGDLNDLFVDCCINENVKLYIVDWLISIGADIHANDDEAFITCCNNGLIERAKMLNEKGANIMAQDHKAFKTACEKNDIAIAKWLKSICRFYNIVYDYRYEYDYYIGGSHVFEYIKEYMIYEMQMKITTMMEDDKLDELYNDATIKKKDDVCMICIDDEHEHWIRFKECKHEVCLDCYMGISKCPMTCNVDFNDVVLVKQNI